MDEEFVSRLRDCCNIHSFDYTDGVIRVVLNHPSRWPEDRFYVTHEITHAAKCELEGRYYVHVRHARIRDEALFRFLWPGVI